MIQAADPYARIKVLEEELAMAHERIAFLEADKEQIDAMVFRFTPREECLFKVLMQRQSCSKEILFDALYFAWPEGDQPEMKIVDVFIHKVRCKLQPFGISIATRWGHGYYMLEPDKDKARAVMNPAAQKQGSHV